MLKTFACITVLFPTSVLADQTKDGQQLAALFDRYALPATAPIHPTERTIIDRTAISVCTLQVQSAIYAPSNQSVTFALTTHDIGTMAFETESNGKRYIFAAYDNEPNSVRLSYRLTPPDAQFNNQIHPLDMAAPLRAPDPDAWSSTDTFGVGSFRMVGDMQESYPISLLAAFDAYQAAYCG